jgi:hypothetical protein
VLPGIPLSPHRSTDGEPVMLTQPLDADIPTFFLPPPDVAVLGGERLNGASGSGPLRYGVPATDITVAMGSRNVTRQARGGVASSPARRAWASCFQLRPARRRQSLPLRHPQTIFGAYDQRIAIQQPEAGVGPSRGPAER